MATAAACGPSVFAARRARPCSERAFFYILAAEVDVYRSTRSDRAAVPPEQALIDGIAPDGGLYVPGSLPRLDPAILATGELSYPELSYLLLTPFFPGFAEPELKSALAAQAERFPVRDPAPLKVVGDRGFLELYHGPTLAFKDFALSLMGSLMGMAKRKLGLDEEIVILVATSGDTGKAALEGLARPGRPAGGIRVVVYYPSEGVSPVQRLQMTSHDAPGAAVIGIRGNFDDAQRGVKAIFANPDAAAFAAKRGMRFSSANSINIARLLPQIAYYVWGWRSMRAAGALGRDSVMDVAVPTGNFGNILAAWYAKRMGLPIGRLICASNRNKVLADFFGERKYDRNRPFYKTESPSMDILVSSNLERLVFHATGEDPVRTADLMARLASKGSYELSDSEADTLSEFRSGWADEAAAAAAARKLFEQSHYLVDPHTAVAVAVLDSMRSESGERRPTLVASTASPFKFPVSAARAIGLEPPAAADDTAPGVRSREGAMRDLDLAERLAEAAGLALPSAVAALRNAPELHSTVVDVSEMERALERTLS
jgi:threonine synthase